MTGLPAQVTTQRPQFDTVRTAFRGVKLEATSGDAFVTVNNLLKTRKGSPLSTPVAVEVRRTETYVAVRNAEHEMMGVGTNYSEALEDFFHALEDYRDVLIKIPHRTNRQNRQLAFCVVVLD